MDRIWLESYPDGVPADIDPDAWPSLNALIDDSLARHRSKPAYVCMDRTMTYGELDARSRAFAAWLGAQGLGRGARVAIMLPNLLQFPVAAHANIMNGGNFCALIGGKVYRGPRFPRLYGRYLYTDYCSGVIRSILPADGGDWTDEQVLAPGLAGNTCIAEDSAGELYLANQITQRVYKLVDRCPMPPPMLMDVDTALQCSDATGYAWYRNGELLPAETGQALHFPADGSYWVVADMGNGCLFTTDTVQVVHTGLPASVPPDGLKVFPNPAMDHLRISLPQQAATSWAITLLDLSGRPVRNWTSMGDHPRTIAVNGLVAGRYLLRVTTGSGTYCAPVGIVH